GSTRASSTSGPAGRGPSKPESSRHRALAYTSSKAALANPTPTGVWSVKARKRALWWASDRMSSEDADLAGPWESVTWVTGSPSAFVSEVEDWCRERSNGDDTGAETAGRPSLDVGAGRSSCYYPDRRNSLAVPRSPTHGQHGSQSRPR